MNPEEQLLPESFHIQWHEDNGFQICQDEHCFADCHSERDANTLLKALQSQCKSSELQREVERLKGELELISLNLCGVKIGERLEGIDEPETDLSMVYHFVEGEIDKQAYLKDQAEAERDTLAQELETALKSNHALREELKKIMAFGLSSFQRMEMLHQAIKIAKDALSQPINDKYVVVERSEVEGLPCNCMNFSSASPPNPNCEIKCPACLLREKVK